MYATAVSPVVVRISAKISFPLKRSSSILVVEPGTQKSMVSTSCGTPAGKKKFYNLLPPIFLTPILIAHACIDHSDHEEGSSAPWGFSA